MIRQHDVQVLTEGTFRVLMTEAGRVLAVLDMPESALGPLHLLFEVLHPVAPYDARSFVRAAESSFAGASQIAPAVARPAFTVARDAAASGVQLLSQAPFVPEEHKEIEAASRIALRARLGDVPARNFMQATGAAARAGDPRAAQVGQALLAGVRMVDHVVDAPLKLAERVPLMGGPLHALDPVQKFDRLSGALRAGDFDRAKTIVTDDARTEIPGAVLAGVGSGMGQPIRVGRSILDNGGALDLAIRAAYATIPIPLGHRAATDAAFRAVLDLVQGPAVTDAAIAMARTRVPAGLPRDVFDTLVQVAIAHVPVQRASGSLVEHYVNHYAPPPVADADEHGAPASAFLPPHIVVLPSAGTSSEPLEPELHLPASLPHAGA